MTKEKAPERVYMNDTWYKLVRKIPGTEFFEYVRENDKGLMTLRTLEQLKQLALVED